MIQKITFLLCVVFTTVLSAQTVQIEGGASYGTIQEAIDAASGGDVILISGVHTEAINIGKSITLRGTDPTIDIIQADASAGTATERVIGLGEGALTITIENLGVQHGNASVNGGGINVEKVTVLVTLKNLIVKDNSTSANGGGITAVGSNVDIVECSILNNTSGSAGGGLMLVSNNASGSGINSVINIKQSLINNNSANNGGGIYLNGNPGFGQNYTITANIENTTISNNTATTGSGGAGGGAIWAKAANHSPGGSASGNGNTILQLVHATVYNNTHSGTTNKGGLQFTSGGTFETFLSAYNSIIVGNDDLATGPKAINFSKVDLTEMKNSILGGLVNATATDTGIIDDAGKNNLKGRTATFSGLTGALSDEGGNTQVISITESSTADDFCTASITGITPPTIDQRGATREVTPDAGAFEFGGTLSTNNITLQNLNIKVYPNPARELVNISSTNAIKAVKIYSILGSLEKEVQDKSTFSVSDLTTGIHVMVIEADNQSLVKRLIVE